MGYSNKQSSGSASDIVFWQTRLRTVINAEETVQRLPPKQKKAIEAQR